MKVLVAFTYCDICNGDANTRVEADESLAIKFQLDGRPKRLDLCTEHKDPSWSAIVDNAIDDLDANVPTPRPTKDRLCPWCNQGVANTAQGVLMHSARKHPEIPLHERQARLGFKVTDRNVKTHPVKAVARKRTQKRSNTQ